MVFNFISLSVEGSTYFTRTRSIVGWRFGWHGQGSASKKDKEHVGFNLDHCEVVDEVVLLFCLKLEIFLLMLS